MFVICAWYFPLIHKEKSQVLPYIQYTFNLSCNKMKTELLNITQIPSSPVQLCKVDFKNELKSFVIRKSKESMKME